MYNRLDELGDDGTFTRPKFKRAMKFYAITDNELVDRMFDLYQENGEVSFDRLVAALCDFKTAPRARQAKMLFRLIDADGGGNLGRMEMFQFLAARLKNIDA